MVLVDWDGFEDRDVSQGCYISQQRGLRAIARNRVHGVVTHLSKSLVRNITAKVDVGMQLPFFSVLRQSSGQMSGL